MAKEHHCLLSIQIWPGEWTQFQCLPFRLCTTPFCVFKGDKAISSIPTTTGNPPNYIFGQPVTSCPVIPQLLQDLSTVLWLFTALEFLINFPKSATQPTQQIEFLEFMVDTTTMTIGLHEQYSSIDKNGQPNSHSLYGEPTLSQLCLLALQIWKWCQAHNITPHVKYLPGKNNSIADWESRHHHNSSNWQLSPSVFKSLNNLLGPFTIDLIASRTNTQYYSWKPDPAAKAVNAFSVPWTQEQLYLFSPFNLIGRALIKIRMETVEYACL